LGQDSPFKEVTVAFMEFAKPTVADGVRTLEKAGCKHIIAVPLLVAPSSHSHFDVPALLGQYTDPDIAATLKEEEAEIVNTRTPITLTQTMDVGEVLQRVMLDRVKVLSRDPEEEALVVLAHGCPIFRGRWEAMLKKTAIYACGKTGITYADWAAVEVGQSYAHHAVPVIAAAAEERKRVLIVGVYLSVSAKQLHDRYMRSDKNPMFGNPLKGKEIVCAEEGILPHDLVARWVAHTALHAAGRQADWKGGVADMEP
jgi:hypothetical protein